MELKIFFLIEKMNFQHSEMSERNNVNLIYSNILYDS